MTASESREGTPPGGILMLAGGSSRRFGTDKRRALLSDGATLLQRSLRAALQSGLPCVLCLAERDRESPPAILPGVEIHFAAGSERGMGATLSSGIRSLPESWSFALVALGDMPWIAPETLRAIAGQAHRDNIVIPLHRGRAGHPVAFGARFFPGLRALDGDRGGRRVIDAHKEAVLELNIKDPGILADVDRAQDLNDREF